MLKPVYDIVNAGPKHRFMVDGSVVSNCGRIFQPQNISKPTESHEIILQGIESLKNGYADQIHSDIMGLISSCIRYAICAPPGKKLLVADLSNIEGRVICYLAGEEWKLQAFRDFDSGIGADLYKVAYAKAFNAPPELVSKYQRTIGKVLELAFGFAGGAGAAVSAAIIYRLELEDLADQALPSIPVDIVKEAESFYDWLDEADLKDAKARAAKTATPSSWQKHYSKKRTRGLDRKVFVAMDSLKRLWRRSHPAIVKLWKDTEEALRLAVDMPNVTHPIGKYCYAQRKGSWTRIVLPSGHSICYPSLRIEEDNRLTYMGTNQFTKKWERTGIHAGKAVENMVQSFARDIFKHGQLIAEQQGYPIVLPVHDELVAEVPDTADYSVHHLEDFMATVPPWAEGIPLAAKGFEDYRYHKDLD